MESLLQEWKGESVVIKYDHPTGAWIFIAIHSTKLGPAAGGTRIKSYPGVQTALKDALRLAEAMTYNNARTIPQLNCRIVAGGANNQLAEPEDAERIKEKGVLYAPDYVINVGGAICLAGMEIQGWTKARMENEVTEEVQNVLQQIFKLAATKEITTEAAARQIAEMRLSADTLEEQCH